MTDETDLSLQGKTLLKIALVDDHELLLGGLIQALGDMPLVEEVAGYQDPAGLIEELSQGRHFDLVVTDLLMGEANGLALAHELSSRFGTPILLMTGVEAPPSQAELERYGIGGFVHKSAPVDVLYEAVLSVGSGQNCFLFPDGWSDQQASPRFGRQSELSNEGAGTSLLSERQFEVLKLVAAGAANKEIASTLAITENTVKTHLKHIFNALGVTKRTACVQAAKSRGLLE